MMSRSSTSFVPPRLPPNRPHRHQHGYHHHHPSWSSSSASHHSPHQRQSAFLIDEYGNQHDPEHCQFKTFRQTSLIRRNTRRSTTSTRSSSTDELHHQPSSIHPIRSSPNHHHLFRIRSHSSLSSQSHHPTMGNQIGFRNPKTKKIRSSLWNSWTSIRKVGHNGLLGNGNGGGGGGNGNGGDENNGSSKGQRKRNKKKSEVFSVRKSIELVKLEIRFSVLRTRKSVLRVWKRL